MTLKWEDLKLMEPTKFPHSLYEKRKYDRHIVLYSNEKHLGSRYFSNLYE